MVPVISARGIPISFLMSVGSFFISDIGVSKWLGFLGFETDPETGIHQFGLRNTASSVSSATAAAQKPT